MLLSINNILLSFAVVASTLIGGSYVVTTDPTYNIIYSSSVENLTTDDDGYLYNPTSSTITGYVLDSSNERIYIVRWQAFSYSQVADYVSSGTVTYTSHKLLYDSGSIDLGVNTNYWYIAILITICAGVVIICFRN